MLPRGPAFRLGHVDPPIAGAGQSRGESGDQVTITTDSDGGRGLPGPAIPDLTLPEFVLCSREPAREQAGAGRRGDRAGAQLRRARRCRAEVGTGLSARGVRPGDVLALCAPNSIEFVVAWYAATSIGAIVTTVNPQWTSEEIVRQLRQTGARWLVTTAGLAGQKLRGVDGGDRDRGDDRDRRARAGTTPFSSLRATAPGRSQAGPPSDGRVATSRSCRRSSGTTGLPKIVVLHPPEPGG